MAEYIYESTFGHRATLDVPDGHRAPMSLRIPLHSSMEGDAVSFTLVGKALGDDVVVTLDDTPPPDVDDLLEKAKDHQREYETLAGRRNVPTARGTGHDDRERLHHGVMAENLALLDIAHSMRELLKIARQTD